MKTKPVDAFHWHKLAILLTLAFATPPASRADAIYVTCYWGNRVEKFDLSTGADLGVFANTGLSKPYGLAFDGVGNLYVANSGTTTIAKFTGGGVGSVFASTGYGTPSGLVFDSAGNLYAANIGDNTIERFAPDGTRSVFTSTGLQGPQGMAFDNSGNLFVTSHDNNTIMKFTPNGVGSVFASLTGPTGLAFDGSGNLYVGSDLNLIEEFSPSGTDLGVFAHGADYNGLGGLAFDRTGNLYATDYYDAVIEKFTPDGTGSILAHVTGQPFSNPMGIVIQQVPEPSVLPLLCLGLSSLIAVRRRSYVPTSQAKQN